jgi:D-erythro-7,8-dihydroneopterin triphosphate epimerase
MRSDEADDALNYKLITKRMIRHVENGRFDLLEKLTGDLLDIATESERVSFARVTVDKPHALRFADSVSVTLCANRGSSTPTGGIPT